jgi:hypothetical protein
MRARKQVYSECTVPILINVHVLYLPINVSSPNVKDLNDACHDQP